MKHVEVKVVGFLSENGKVYARKGNATKATNKFNQENEVRSRNKLKNKALLKGWKFSEL